MKRNQGNNSIVSFLALVLLTYFVFLPIVFAILLKKFGSPVEIFYSIIDKLPFGLILGDLAETVWKFISTFGTTALKLPNIDSFDLFFVFQESLKELAVLMLYEPLSLVICNLFGLKDATGHWNKMKKALILSCCAIVSVVFSPLIITFFENQIQQFDVNTAKIIEAVTGIITAAGSIGVFALLGGAAFVGVIFGVLLLSALQLECIYLFLLVFLLALQEGNFFAGVVSISGIIITAILVGLMSILLESKRPS